MKRGDIVIASFPQSASAASAPKNRPVLIVQANYYNQRIHNVLVAVITSNLARKSDVAHFFIEAQSPVGKLAGLNQDSLVSCLNLAVMLKNDLGRKIGELSIESMRQIDDCLKAAMGIG